jgi:hypothetical protein
MTAVEIVARALATCAAQGKYTRGPDDQDNHSVRRYADIFWVDHVAGAKRLLRSLKDQPIEIADAGAACVSSVGALNAMLEAMAVTNGERQ